MPHDLQPFLDAVEAIVASHRIAPGFYRRWNWQRVAGGPARGGKAPPPRDLGPNEYGCADAANLLYTLGRFPTAPTERQRWIAALQGMQKEDSGHFVEATHHPVHTTAHCVAALELFDARPLAPIHAEQPLTDPAALEVFLSGLDWRAQPWNESHRGAGLYAALVLTRAVDRAWEDRYFAWLWEHADPATGLWRKGCIAPVDVAGVASRFPHLAGSFHYLFNHEYARRPLRYPAALVDCCLTLRARDPFPFCRSVGFAEIDWVYCLTRALRQSGHRFAEGQTALRAFAAEYVAFLNGLNPATHDGLNDLHCLFGAICCLAELQTALPGELPSDRPLKLVLDRRPFI
ncbi:MAG: hypothetical protein ACREJ2_03955 [Planctomycetota bacterium]